MAKKNMLHLPVLITIALLLIVIFIVTRKGNSPIASTIQLLSSYIEGFESKIITTPKCPAGYSFFNDSLGESLCCAGSINPYSHTCEASGATSLCSFRPDVPNPNGAGMLPLCSTLITKQYDSESKACPRSLPNYASIGKCCKSGTDLDGNDCIREDNQDVKRYCKLKGPLSPGERLCSSIQLYENSVCPSGFQKIQYRLGDREKTAYGASASNMYMPVCFGMDRTCIPDNVIQEMQKNGIYKNKELDTWSYSCSGWSRVNVKRDLTGKMDQTYV